MVSWYASTGLPGVCGEMTVECQSVRHDGRVTITARLLALVLAFTSVLGGSLIVATPAKAANPETTFYIRQQGVAATTRGNLIWYNRSVRVGGYVSRAFAASAYVDIYAVANDKVTDSARREASTSFGFTLDADVKGGVDYVFIDLWVHLGAGSGWHYVGTDRCTRNGCSNL